LPFPGWLAWLAGWRPGYYYRLWLVGGLLVLLYMLGGWAASYTILAAPIWLALMIDPLANNHDSIMMYDNRLIHHNKEKGVVFFI
jgi:hypothetical protein